MASDKGKSLEAANTILGTSLDNEFLQSFVRDGKGETGLDSKPKVSEEVAGVCSKAKKELDDDKGKKKRRRGGRVRTEELYTDKDRAAAVNMGSKDIKQSLKLKRQQDRSRFLGLPDEADPAQFLVLGYYEMGRREIEIGLSFFNKALELNPLEKHALVARSKCYILIGQPEKGLQDAETALTIDKSFLKAIYQKAEALYHLGDFEHSLMYFHRGLHVRPDHDDFKSGVEKAQKAIENALGIGFNKKSTTRTRSATPSRSKSSASNNNNNNHNEQQEKKVDKIRRSANSSAFSAKKKSPSNRLLRELAVDKEYLDGLLSNPDIHCKGKEVEKDPVLEYIQEAVQYLNQRQEFWRQQLPPNKI